MFFKLAVLGPIVTSGLGVAQQCLACYRARGLADESAACAGFGPGCLGYRPITIGAAADVADNRVKPKKQ